MRHSISSGTIPGTVSGRSQRAYWRKREDLPWIETEFDQEFRRWIVDFPKEQLPRIYRMLEKYSDNRELFVFRKREDAEAYLALLEQRK